LDDFVDSFSVFERDSDDFYENKEEDFKKIKAYYKVLNRLCSLGNVEKMYIAPILDPKLGNFENQLIFEHGFADELGVKSGGKLLEAGCGRGRITHTIASRTGAHVTAFNIDESQLVIANKFAEETDLQPRPTFVEHNMNDKFPFPDNHFDGFYQVQAMTYAANLTSVICNISRVIKPGAKISLLDGVAKDAYDRNNPEHRRLLIGTREVTGFGALYHYGLWNQAVEDCGMKLISSKEASLGGKQGPLILQEFRHFSMAKFFVDLLVKIGVLPYHLNILMERFMRHIEDYVEMDDKLMLTTSWHIIAQKL
jgi:sterol 24-C-methyltransferase